MNHQVPTDLTLIAVLSLIFNSYISMKEEIASLFAPILNRKFIFRIIF